MNTELVYRLITTSGLFLLDKERKVPNVNFSAWFHRLSVRNCLSSEGVYLLRCSVAQKGCCVTQFNAAYLRRVQRSSGLCSVAHVGAA